jgi:hypothetical protein
MEFSKGAGAKPQRGLMPFEDARTKASPALLHLLETVKHLK